MSSQRIPAKAESGFLRRRETSEDDPERVRYLNLPMPMNHPRLRDFFNDGNHEYKASALLQSPKSEASTADEKDLKNPAELSVLSSSAAKNHSPT